MSKLLYAYFSVHWTRGCVVQTYSHARQGCDDVVYHTARGRLDWLRLSIVLVVGALSVIASVAQARMADVTEGLMCDDLGQVIAIIDRVRADTPDLRIESGCRLLKEAVVADVTVLREHETVYARYLLAEFNIGGLVQYGFIDVRMKRPVTGM